ncbi:hypothetical protein [Sphaerochaeta sp. PS]|uniref:hypothetical protein n=1 Tax=Sphaerochaeta sp. PS TaxID=3076336 RepID=UPI0028A31F87|nr:hypothetical protein [Sphaerochaeta sp. PS]MDT4761143.1 hypothetical protein [Sphaerochaeta sp. PS]
MALIVCTNGQTGSDESHTYAGRGARKTILATCSFLRFPLLESNGHTQLAISFGVLMMLPGPV